MDEPEVLKALADLNRLRILNILDRQALCVCDLESGFVLQHSNMSRHLSKLKQAGLVTVVKRGLFAYYSRAIPSGPWSRAVQAVLDVLGGAPDFAKDRQRLDAYLAQSSRQC